MLSPLVPHFTKVRQLATRSVPTDALRRTPVLLACDGTDQHPRDGLSLPADESTTSPHARKEQVCRSRLQDDAQERKDFCESGPT